MLSATTKVLYDFVEFVNLSHFQGDFKLSEESPCFRHLISYAMRSIKDIILIMMHSILLNMAHKRANGYV